MNKTTVVFYLSTFAGALALFAKVSGSLISTKADNWLIAASLVISFLAFQFYEFFTGQNQPPQPPVQGATFTQGK